MQRISGMLVAVAAVSALAMATSACSDPKTLITGPEGRGRRVLVIDEGHVPPEQLIRMVEPVVAEAAADGATIRVLLVTGGSSAAATEVDLSAANGGDFTPKGKNPPAWRDEAANNAAAANDAISAALAASEPDGTGADLLGALADAARLAPRLPGKGDPEVIGITGGGVHRTVALDLLAVEWESTTPEEVAAQAAVLEAPDVSLWVIGAGRFPGVQPPPSVSFAQGVRLFWVEVCERSATASCSVTDHPNRIPRKDS